MCGLAGVFYFDQQNAQSETIKRMTDCLSHRGPDADGFYSDANISLGHRRLSIIDLSAVANQPLIDHAGRYVLIFNGEIYNFADVKKQFPSYPYTTSGDSEVILAAYGELGPSCLDKFAGMFVFAIWDKQQNELFIARDRMGVKPLYYFLNEKYVVFASEIRALLKSGLVPRKLSKEGLYDFFSYQSVGYPFTIIDGVKQLEAGSYLKIRSNSFEEVSYWNIAEVAVKSDYINEQLTKKEVRRLLLKSVERRLVSDVPVGAFLSGGIDSSAIVGLMAEASGNRPNTFTASFEEKEFDESAYADIVAKKFNTNHTDIRLRPTVFIDELENALNAMDTPSGDGINTYVVSKAIRKAGITVALSGLGGDELFAGYPTFSNWARLKKYDSLWPLTIPVRKLISKSLSFSSSGKVDRIKELWDQPALNIENVYPGFRRVLSRKQLNGILDIKMESQTSIEQQFQKHANSIHKFPLLSQMTIAELSGYTQHTLLKDTDQMSMAVSLEVREPYFDHELVEYVLGIPDKWKAPTYAKSFLVESLDGLLPPEIVHRKKQGFVFPWKLWLKRDLRSFGEKHIYQMAERDFINKPSLLKLWSRFQNNDSSVRWADLWLFIVLDYWLENNSIND
ncbi:MAG TPA: asparagine synthase (glutamine-hydrolyzing) [Flavitalea sp.]|nr:asparagine synthase (glutamine-hydrolyzing) [Flavitalea sp.]